MCPALATGNSERSYPAGRMNKEKADFNIFFYDTVKTLAMEYHIFNDEGPRRGD
jgi:hypothetical protein